MQTGPAVQNVPRNLPNNTKTNQGNPQQQAKPSWIEKLFNNSWINKITALIPIAFSAALGGCIMAAVLLMELYVGHLFVEPFLSNVPVITGLAWAFGGFGLVSLGFLSLGYYNGYTSGKDIFSFVQGFAFAASVHLAFFLPLQLAYGMYFALSATAMLSGAWMFLYQGYVELTKPTEDGTTPQPSVEESQEIGPKPESKKPTPAPQSEHVPPSQEKNKSENPQEQHAPAVDSKKMPTASESPKISTPNSQTITPAFDRSKEKNKDGEELKTSVESPQLR